MDNSLKAGLMAIVAVSGSVVFVAMHAHNRLLSNFMKEIEFEIKYSTGQVANFALPTSVQQSNGTVKEEPKKMVRFADDDVAESTAERAFYKRRHVRRLFAASGRNDGENLEAMPQNWQVMYKGILQHRNIRWYN